jgi:hypothetical protein
MNASIWWESQLERDYIYLLEIDTDAVAYCEQPFTIAYDRHNRRKKYTPDFLVERRCSKQVIEVKPKSKVESFVKSDRFLNGSLFVGNQQDRARSLFENNQLLLFQ